MALKSMCKHWLCLPKSHVGEDVTPIEPFQQGQWASLPPELLLDIIQRVEKSETSWPARTAVVSCASVCKSWRAITKEIIKTPQQCGKITFPISLKQPAPRDYQIPCFIKTKRETSTFLLYLGLVPTRNQRCKLLLAARKTRRATGTDIVISLAADDFSQSSKNYVGKLTSNFWENKFTIYDTHSPYDTAIQPNCQGARFNSKQVSLRAQACCCLISTILYDRNTRTTRRPIRMSCFMSSIPGSAIDKDGTAPTPTSLPPALKRKSPMTDSYSNSVSELPGLSECSVTPLVLLSRPHKWCQPQQCWANDRITVNSVNNFQLVASMDLSRNVFPEEKDRVILQFGMISTNTFIMDYSYPLSAFQAFAICLSSFVAKPIR
ncbi:tubby-like F-box protein 5 [Cicer arietinum]|uniref:Tubby-like F-box protein 5 n=1 Tax=Cicer arietinum TaxID=3827 RepID=A0A3Q7YGK6_CICAR|nr:tubby-like F-box protein 5 [Cicer arietinum]XP_027192405.1 tubby-like F-box protein 5 [Cicer arietinum]